MVERDSARVLGDIGGKDGGKVDPDFVVNLAVSAAAMGDGSGEDAVEDLMVSSRRHFHVLRPVDVPAGPPVLVYMRLLRGRANLALARRELASAEIQRAVLDLMGVRGAADGQAGGPVGAAARASAPAALAAGPETSGPVVARGPESPAAACPAAGPVAVPPADPPIAPVVPMPRRYPAPSPSAAPPGPSSSPLPTPPRTSAAMSAPAAAAQQPALTAMGGSDASVQTRRSQVEGVIAQLTGLHSASSAVGSVELDDARPVPGAVGSEPVAPGPRPAASASAEPAPRAPGRIMPASAEPAGAEPVAPARITSAPAPVAPAPIAPTGEVVGEVNEEAVVLPLPRRPRGARLPPPPPPPQGSAAEDTPGGGTSAALRQSWARDLGTMQRLVAGLRRLV